MSLLSRIRRFLLRRQLDDGYTKLRQLREEYEALMHYDTDRAVDVYTDYCIERKRVLGLAMKEDALK